MAIGLAGTARRASWAMPPRASRLAFSPSTTLRVKIRVVLARKARLPA